MPLIKKEAADEGLVEQYVPIKWSVDHEKTAFVRAAEVSVALKAERLSNNNNWTAFPSGNSLSGETLDLNPDGFLKEIENWHAEKAHYMGKRRMKHRKSFYKRFDKTNKTSNKM